MLHRPDRKGPSHSQRFMLHRPDRKGPKTQPAISPALTERHTTLTLVFLMKVNEQAVSSSSCVCTVTSDTKRRVLASVLMCLHSHLGYQAASSSQCSHVYAQSPRTPSGELCSSVCTDTSDTKRRVVLMCLHRHTGHQAASCSQCGVRARCRGRSCWDRWMTISLPGGWGLALTPWCGATF